MEVVRLERARLGEASDVLARAFHDDPAWVWLLPDAAAARAAPAVALPGRLRRDRRRRVGDRRAGARRRALAAARAARRCASAPTLRALVTTPLRARRGDAPFLAYGRAVEALRAEVDARAALVPRRDRRRARRRSARGSARRCSQPGLDRGRARRAAGRAADEQRGATSPFYEATRLRGRARGSDAGGRPARLGYGQAAVSATPKRFPDRDEIAAVRAEAEALEAGAEGADDAPARRPRDGAARHGQARLPRPRRPLGPHPAALPGRAHRRGRRPPRRRRRRRRASRRRARRGEPSLIVDELELLSRDPLAAPGHLPRPHRRRAALPPPLPRPADERGDARRLHPARADRHGDPRATSTTTASSRSRRRSCSRATAARSREPFVTHSQRARPGPLPAHRDRALPQAADRRRAREGLRDRQGLPQRGRLVQAQPRVHDARVVRGVRRLPGHDGADRDASSSTSRSRRSARRRSTFTRPRDRPEGAVAARAARSTRSQEHDLWTRDDDELRAAPRGARRRHVAATRRGRSSSTRRSPHYVEPRLIEPTILYDYPIELSPFARTTDDDRRIVERFEYYVGGMELGNAFTRAERRRGAGGAVRDAGRGGRRRQRRGRAGRPGLRRGALVRHAADGRARPRHRPARDGAGRARTRSAT